MRFLLPVALLGCPIFSGCSTYLQDWESHTAPALAPASGDAAPLGGRWEGSWRSAANGHHGALRCIVTPNGDGNGCVARYRAEYGCCFTFEYTVPMTVNVDGEMILFEGSADLGWLAGGVYTYTGFTAGDGFYADYHTKHDHGVFQLGRVP